MDGIMECLDSHMLRAVSLIGLSCPRCSPEHLHMNNRVNLHLLAHEFHHGIVVCKFVAITWHSAHSMGL